MPEPIRPFVVKRTGLLIEDEAVRLAIGFALGVEGFELATLSRQDAYAIDDLDGLSAVVLDVGDANLEAISQLLKSGFSAEGIIVLATAPSLTLQHTCKNLGATLIEKPLLCDELIAAIRRMNAENGMES